LEADADSAQMLRYILSEALLPTPFCRAAIDGRLSFKLCWPAFVWYAPLSPSFTAHF
jgi:hypothetical protein